MGILELVRSAIESLAANKLRTALTMLGVIIGVGAVVTLLALGAGVQNYIGAQIAGIGSNLITIQTDNRSGGARLTMSDVTALSERVDVPDLVTVVPVVQGNDKVSAGILYRATQIQGATIDLFRIRNVKIAQGTLFTQVDNEQRNRVVVLGGKLADTLFPKGGALDQTVLIGSVPFRVVGITEVTGTFGPGGSSDDAAFVPLNVAMEKLYPNRAGGLKALNTIYGELTTNTRAEAATNDITRILRAQHGLLAGQNDDFRIFTQAQVANTLNTVVTALTAFLGAIGAISLLVGGIGIMNIMLVTVTERTREIGVRKAIGASDGAIRWQFLIEALVVTMLAGLLGVAFGWGLSFVIGKVQTTLVPEVQAYSVAISFGVSVFIGVVFGLYPAWRASMLPPVEALRYE